MPAADDLRALLDELTAVSERALDAVADESTLRALLDERDSLCRRLAAAVGTGSAGAPAGMPPPSRERDALLAAARQAETTDRRLLQGAWAARDEILRELGQLHRDHAASQAYAGADRRPGPGGFDVTR